MFRRAVVDDIPSIAALKYKMLEETGMAHRLLPDFHQMVDEDYRQFYHSGTAQHFVVERDSQIIACAGAFIKDDAPYRYLKLRSYGFIADVYVEPQFRRQGLAKALTNATLDWFAERNIRLFRLVASDEARPLYESLGFSATKEMGMFR
ncbi:Ribosomal protein S18 acetylase RimI [Paenibacillus sp. 1_12]|uniref:GNAT family N-acetyltransferase n=1 Tax=Paenibacillus sp. 1_12 TaxID=1566278 RepID=UPI0008DFC8F0|nr:GNAT family N-acetyltransferase [Paenibacillus sp. 1_12]SFM45816.1 Ribosomal protein S18 acetylase RimI [Paenibacillus sp. 1_12]